MEGRERRRSLSLTLAAIAQDPARIAEATPDDLAGLYGDVERLRARILARLPGLASPRPWPEYLSLEELSAYSGISKRVLQHYVNLPPHQALPAYRTPGIGASGKTGKLRVRRTEFDAWIAQYRTQGRPSLTRALREMGLDKLAV